MIANIDIKNFLPKLETLSIANNRITVITPHFWKSLPLTIKKVALFGNSFDCSCKNAPFVDWLSNKGKQNNVFVLYKEYLCHKYFGITVFKFVNKRSCKPRTTTVFSLPSKFTFESSTSILNTKTENKSVYFTNYTTELTSTKLPSAFENGLFYLIGLIILSILLIVLLVKLINRFYKTRLVQSSPVDDVKLPKENFELEKLNPLSKSTSLDESVTITSTSESSNSGNAKFNEDCPSLNKH